ncbi:sister chromatid cohesion protein DCC1-like [Teratosphaeria destructans]|uniref:Sister chromatid cohesion protein DCC1-like n=1 Tax=Teratosphaeria destructans TaxID=418781 RepID=A0A9W7SW04_9PEZI|nr:sister chromatid cohesion protein DCC1-like [Teratosphaeria destructans]
MSTQSATNDAADFFVLPEESQQQFRLLELPPELLEILTSADAKPIHFKSSPDSASPITLCTPTQTYAARQVNTSNTVYITQPHSTTTAGILATAKSDFTYELTPNPPTPDTVTRHLRAILPLYTSTGTLPLHATKAKKPDLLADLPFSTLDCERGWKRLACFELDHDEAKCCFVPSGEAKLQAWNSIIQRAREYGVDLTADAFDESLLLMDADAEVPVELSRAILRSVAVDGDDASRLDASETVRQTGSWRLEATRGPMKVVEFVEEWKDLLPERWREMAKLEDLKGEIEVVEEGREVRLAAGVGGGSRGAVGEKAGAVAEAKSLGAKRKWHEKFRASMKGA